MSESRHWRVLFRSPLLTITDHHCRPTDPACGVPECATRCEVVFPRSGVFVKHVGGRQTVADVNRVVFFRAGEPYQVSHPVPGGDVCTSFALHSTVLRALIACHAPALADRPGSPLPDADGPSGPNEFLAHRSLLRSLAGAGPVEPLSVEEAALALLHRVFQCTICGNGPSRRPARSRTRRAHRDAADAVRTLLAAHMESNLTLDDLARMVHVSPFHLARVFRRLTGLPIHRYRNRLRLRASLERLADGHQDLTELAVGLGYSSHSHFSDAFRREFGVSPSAFRRSASRRFVRQMSKIPEA